MSAAASDGVGFCGGVVALLAGLMPLRLGPGKRRRDHPGDYLNPGWPPSGILRVRRPLTPTPARHMVTGLVSLALFLPLPLTLSFAVALPLFHCTAALASLPVVPD